VIRLGDHRTPAGRPQGIAPTMDARPWRIRVIVGATLAVAILSLPVVARHYHPTIVKY